MMKSICLVLTLLFSSAVYCQNQVETKIDRFPNGVPRAEYSFYRDSNGDEVWHGKRIEWTQGGQRFSEGSYVNGKAEGLRTYWHENGRKSAEGNYHDNLPVGVWLKWYPDGQLQEKCEYENGQKNGTCAYWSETNREADIVRYVKGKPLPIVEWEKLNEGKHRAPVYLYPYIVVRPDDLTFTSNYEGISREFLIEELEQMFISLPKSVWVNGKEIGVTKIGLASREQHKRMDDMMQAVVNFFRSKGYRIQYLPH